MYKPPPIDPQNAAMLATWLASIRTGVEALRAFFLDATLPANERVYSRKYLRRVGLRRLRDLEFRLTVVCPTPPQAASPEQATIPPPAAEETAPTTAPSEG